jgi:hypothetical protein
LSNICIVSLFLFDIDHRRALAKANPKAPLRRNGGDCCGEPRIIRVSRDRSSCDSPTRRKACASILPAGVLTRTNSLSFERASSESGVENGADALMTREEGGFSDLDMAKKKDAEEEGKATLGGSRLLKLFHDPHAQCQFGRPLNFSSSSARATSWAPTKISRTSCCSSSPKPSTKLQSGRQYPSANNNSRSRA